MWVWRDDTALGTRGTGSARRGGTAPGWRLDASGTWTWDEPSLLEREGVGVGALRGDVAPRRASGGRAPASRGAEATRAETTLGGTPIFNALAVDRSRRETLRAVPDPRDRWADDERPRADGVPSIPEPHPGSGPLPIQDADGGRGRRGLAAVPTVPPPPLPGEPAGPAAPAGHDDVAESPQDELRRRAERRRRPHRAAEDAEAGRHAMRRPAASGGRHAMH